MEELYQARKTALLQGPFSEASVNQQLDKWSAQIEAAVEEADRLHEDAITVRRWKGSVDLLKQQLEVARNK